MGLMPSSHAALSHTALYASRQLAIPLQPLLVLATRFVGYPVLLRH